MSEHAIELYRANDVIDLHVDSFIWHRLFGYDLTHRHRPLLAGALFGQVDFPRIRAAEISGATWVITTNPLRDRADRAATFERNLNLLVAQFARVEHDFALVTDRREYDAARALGKHAAFLGVQGGNALELELDQACELYDRRILRVTLVHLSSSRIGTTSSPLKLESTGLSSYGRELIQLLNHRKILVDLAHIDERGFWQAVDAHAHELPLIVSHTGVNGVHRHWRNLSDDQLRAVARSGGVVGIMYHAPYLGDHIWAGRAESIVRHLEHVANVAGEATPALGSDWDGAIVTPRDMPTCLELPRLVQLMLERRWPEARIRATLGQNFLRVLAHARG
ncbi:MAG TPA: membrane dipeptidase [Polyangiaceae bacterium]